MLTVNDDHIRTLSEAFRGTDAEAGGGAGLVGEGESPEFYRGVITGLLFCYDLLRRRTSEGEELTRAIALTAAHAAIQYRRAKGDDGEDFAEFIIQP